MAWLISQIKDGPVQCVGNTMLNRYRMCNNFCCHYLCNHATSDRGMFG